MAEVDSRIVQACRRLHPVVGVRLLWRGVVSSMVPPGRQHETAMIGARWLSALGRLEDESVDDLNDAIDRAIVATSRPWVGALEAIAEVGAAIAGNPKKFREFNALAIDVLAPERWEVNDTAEVLAGRRPAPPTRTEKQHADRRAQDMLSDLLTITGAGRYRFHCRCARIVDDNWGDSFGGPDEGLHWLWLAALVDVVEAALVEPNATPTPREGTCPDLF